MPNPEQEQDTDSKDENKYIAMMGYQKDDPDEVTIMEGDMVDVLQKSFSGSKHLKKMICRDYSSPLHGQIWESSPLEMSKILPFPTGTEKRP